MSEENIFYSADRERFNYETIDEALEARYCEDQARDFYRIGSAQIIGNSYEKPELLEAE